MILFL
jgi:hypothetical protein